MSIFNAKLLNQNYDFEINGVSSIIDPKDNTIIFCNQKYFLLYKENILNIKNCIIFIPKDSEIEEANNLILKVENPRYEYAKLLNKIFEIKEHIISSRASISKKANISSNVSIGDFCLIEDDVIIEEGTIIKSGTKILNGSRIGKNCIISENSVIGCLGLAFEKFGEEYLYVPQLGKLIIEENVYIGANTSIAKGAINNTIIGRGTKIDNNVFISHNVVLGKNCIVVGNTLLMGSVKVGDNSYISGGTTVRDNINLGKNVIVGLGSVVVQSVEDFKTVYGNPAREKKLIKE